MIHLKTAAIGAILCLTAACATTGANVVPVVDGPVSPNFNSDLAQCQALARSQPVMSGSTAGSASRRFRDGCRGTTSAWPTPCGITSMIAIT